MPIHEFQRVWIQRLLGNQIHQLPYEYIHEIVVSIRATAKCLQTLKQKPNTANAELLALAHENIEKIADKSEGFSDRSVEIERQCILATQQGADIHLLLDHSDSVGHEVFEEKLKPYAVELVKRLDLLAKRSRGCMKWSAIAFGPVELVSDGTESIDDFLDLIRKHPFRGGGTPTAEALHRAVGTFDLTTNRFKMIFIFTGGCPDGEEEAKVAFQTAHQENIVVIGLGVGSSLGAVKLRQFCSEKCAFQVNSFDQLSRLLDRTVNCTNGNAKTAKAITSEDFEKLIDKSSNSLLKLQAGTCQHCRLPRK
jgi:hypothetical protein